MKKAAFAALLALIAGPAGASSPADDARAEYAAAVDRAQARAAQRWAFTMTYTDLSTAAPKSYRSRFDPRRPAGARWEALDPPAASMTKDERKAFKEASRNDDADDALVYDSLKDTLAEAEAVEITEDQAVFRIPVDGPDLPKGAAEALAVAATLDRVAGRIAAIEIVSRSPFKPAPIVKVDQFRQLHRYEPAGADGAVLLVASESDTAGRAMFKPFRSTVRIAYSDFEAVDGPPWTPKKK